MILLPWPDPRLSPNFKRRHHWTKYRDPARTSREAGCILTCAAIPKEHRMALAKLERIPMTIRFIPPDKRNRDDDSMIGAFKHLRDGMADAIGCDDRIFAPTYEVAEPQAPGRVEVNLCCAQMLSQKPIAPANPVLIDDGRPTTEAAR